MSLQKKNHWKNNNFSITYDSLINEINKKKIKRQTFMQSIQKLKVLYNFEKQKHIVLFYTFFFLKKWRSTNRPSLFLTGLVLDFKSIFHPVSSLLLWMLQVLITSTTISEKLQNKIYVSKNCHNILYSVIFSRQKVKIYWIINVRHFFEYNIKYFASFN